MNLLTEWRIRKALTQPILTMGTEKPLLIMNIVLCLVLAMASRFSWPAFFSIPLFVIIHGFCMMASKHDPRAVEVYRRSTRYSQGFYPALAGKKARKVRAFKSFPENIKVK